METDAIIGLILILAAVAANIALALWSRHLIHWIERTGPRSARKIIKDLHRGR